MKDNISLKDYLNIVWENKKQILLITFVAGILSIFISLLLPKWYKGTAVILSPTTSNPMSAFGGLQSLGLGNLFSDNE
ncbi:MAG: Wzz/FepE/Etk N-terminal domain-containing protein, partial [Candidatus Marinimicrobia bacterium]|nr:Wzz/FepE/Etk N-terminal domain-containing protein [Candidatus Neomarinimicrobiota bacterium]